MDALALKTFYYGTMNLLSKSLQVHLFHMGSKHFSTPSKYLDWVVSIWTLWGPTTLTSMYHGVQIFRQGGTIFWGGVHFFVTDHSASEYNKNTLLGRNHLELWAANVAVPHCVATSFDDY